MPPRRRRLGPPLARPEDVAAHAHATWDDDMIQCRMKGRHDPQPLGAAINDKDGTWEETRRCPRCGTEEREVRSLRTGARISRKTDYSNAKDGYRLPKGSGLMTAAARDAIWLEYFSRAQPASPKRSRRRKAA